MGVGIAYLPTIDELRGTGCIGAYGGHWGFSGWQHTPGHEPILPRSARITCDTIVSRKFPDSSACPAERPRLLTVQPLVCPTSSRRDQRHTTLPTHSKGRPRRASMWSRAMWRGRRLYQRLHDRPYGQKPTATLPSQRGTHASAFILIAGSGSPDPTVGQLFVPLRRRASRERAETEEQQRRGRNRPHQDSTGVAHGFLDCGFQAVIELDGQRRQFPSRVSRCRVNLSPHLERRVRRAVLGERHSPAPVPSGWRRRSWRFARIHIAAYEAGRAREAAAA